ncbi:hypothetical protein FN846DRAFT_954897 [Sphaerosporella brunnea]|uniref:Rhodopsin domain-containing protein n=1 Tax=Sphaerosporella brunnea TaxID=1250544 RepID=A0A5J5ET57_9PEZI|nr:hypothetical protein FN846DRAFT_954897 [Sphaerosporella brunnea]
MTVTSPTAHDLAVESWTFYSIGVVLIFLRMLSRRLVVGSFRNYQLEDYVMLVDLVMYTLLMVGLNISGRTATNLMGPGVLETLTPEDIKQRIYGSKIVILVEQSMLTCVWLTKACMLMVYNRLSQRLPHQRAIKFIAVYTALGFVACELTWFLNCRPLSGYWALPVPDPQCATYTHYVIVQGVFNLSSDIMMLSVGIPLILKANVGLKKKLMLVAIFGLGFFVILAAVLSKYYNFSYYWTTIYMVWYIREASTAIYVANIPLLWPLFARIFKAGSFAGSSMGKDGSAATHELTAGSQFSRSRIGNKIRHLTDTQIIATEMDNSSQERINKCQVEVETRVSLTVEQCSGSSSSATKYDVENYGASAYSASISGGPCPGKH